MNELLVVFGVFVLSGILAFGLAWLVHWLEDNFYLHLSEFGFFILAPLTLLSFAAWIVWIGSGRATH